MDKAREIIATAMPDALERHYGYNGYIAPADEGYTIVDGSFDLRAVATDIVSALISAGYRIIPPGEFDKVSLEAAARCSDQWSKPEAIKLAAGEMTAQELRTAIAVGKGIATAIRRLAEEAE